MTDSQGHGSDGAAIARELRAQAQLHGAHNYHPLPVVITEADGAWVTDVEGRRYLDMLAAYSADYNFGHRHPRLVAAAQRQLERRHAGQPRRSSMTSSARSAPSSRRWPAWRWCCR